MGVAESGAPHLATLGRGVHDHQDKEGDKIIALQQRGALIIGLIRFSESLARCRIYADFYYAVAVVYEGGEGVVYFVQTEAVG